MFINYNIFLVNEDIQPSISHTSSTVTWKYKDEESTDSPDNTDHFADVWNEHCYEKSDCDPGCGQGNTGTALVRLRHRRVFVSLPQQWILDHRSTHTDRSIHLDT